MNLSRAATYCGFGNCPPLGYYQWAAMAVVVQKWGYPLANHRTIDDSPAHCRYCPWPDKFTITCEAFPFNAMDRVPFTSPVAVGLKVTLMVQLAPGASVLPQLFVCVYTLGAAVIDWIVIAVVAALAKVTGKVALVPTFCKPKRRLTGNTTVVSIAPMPLSVTTCGPPKASSLMVSVALSATGLLGSKVT